MATLVLVFKNIESEDKTIYDTFYSHSEKIINESDIDDLFKYIYATIISNIEKSLGKGSGRIIDSAIDNPLAESSNIKLQNELDHQRKELVNIQNVDDNGCFKLCFVST